MAETQTSSIEQLAINTIRTLSMDAVEAAKSGHPGTPMALAPVGYVIFNDILRYDPTHPLWVNRDRFVLSCGHASMLLYSLLHLAQVQQVDDNGRPTGELAVPLDHIRQFRQLHSRCPGHPEYRHTSGVEVTTGPLGQGVGTSVGMAIAGKWLAARYNRPGFDLFNYGIYVLCSDGDLMEGVSSEAASLAGHLKLGNLCWIYDDNQITIEGHTSLAFSEDVAARFRAYGWDVHRVDDVNDLDSLRDALKQFNPSGERPTLIIVKSIIAWGAPNKQNTHEAHGAPLGEEEIRLAKQFYGWPVDAKFLVPPEVLEHFRAGIGTRGPQLREQWESLFAKYAESYPQEADEIRKIINGELPKGWDRDIPAFPADAKGLATRASSGKVLNAVA
ncbi:MAG: transketolase, partial [Thermogutta sp.]|nr:transketolase [Thermogutta sp.]